MIKRTQREATAVRKLVERTPPDFLACRGTGRHPFGTPEISLDQRPGLRELALAARCPCGTVRTDRWRVRVHADGSTLDLREHVGRVYTYPDGYLLPHGSPRVHREDWLTAWLSGQLLGRGLRLAG
jgi:hypothetical protein